MYRPRCPSAGQAERTRWRTLREGGAVTAVSRTSRRALRAARARRCRPDRRWLQPTRCGRRGGSAGRRLAGDRFRRCGCRCGPASLRRLAEVRPVGEVEQYGRCGMHEFRDGRRTRGTPPCVRARPAAAIRPANRARARTRTPVAARRELAADPAQPPPGQARRPVSLPWLGRGLSTMSGSHGASRPQRPTIGPHPALPHWSPAQLQLLRLSAPHTGPAQQLPHDAQRPRSFAQYHRRAAFPA